MSDPSLLPKITINPAGHVSIATGGISCPHCRKLIFITTQAYACEEAEESDG